MAMELEQNAGAELARILGLKKDARGFYDTEWGPKTDIGLYTLVDIFTQDVESQRKGQIAQAVNAGLNAVYSAMMKPTEKPLDKTELGE